MGEQWKQRASSHILLAMAANLHNRPRQALHHATMAEIGGSSDVILLEQALALEQLGQRALAVRLWSIVRRRNPGAGGWTIVARAFLDGDESALSRIEGWDSRRAGNGSTRAGGLMLAS